MKKLFAFLIILCLMASLAACGEKAEKPVTKEKTTLAIEEIAEGEYTGTLSSCSYTTEGTDEKTQVSYKIAPDLSESQLKVTVKEGQITLYAETLASAAGEIEGVETPRSPEYTVIISGTLPLKQKDKNTVCAEGDVNELGSEPWIYWDGNAQFTKWSMEDLNDANYTYACIVK